MCVQCAETVKSLEKINKRYPIDGALFAKGFFGPQMQRSRVNGEQITEVRWRSAYARVTYSDLNLILTATDFGPMEIRLPEKEPLRVSNILSAWSTIRTIIERHQDPHFTGDLFDDLVMKK